MKTYEIEILIQKTRVREHELNIEVEQNMLLRSKLVLEYKEAEMAI